MRTKLTGVVLAAGLGTRMDPLTRLVAKPAIPFLGRPLIHYSLDNLNKAEVDRIHINLHYLPETVEIAVRNYLATNPGSTPVSFSREESILGTSGVLKPLVDELAESTILLSNGKIYLEEDLRIPCRVHWEEENLVTLILRRWSPDEAFNPVQVGPSGRVLGFGRRALSFDASYHTYTGVQILSPRYLSHIPDGYSDSVKDIFPRLIADGARIGAYITEAPWYENSDPSSYLENSLSALRAVTGSPQAQCVEGQNVTIGEDTVLRSVVLWDRCVIGSQVRLERVIVTSDVHVPDGFTASDCILLSEPASGQGEYSIWPLGERHQ